MALGDPNDPLAPYLDSTVPLDGDALFRLYFGGGAQVPNVFPDVNAPVPVDAPLQVPPGSNDRLPPVAAPPPPPAPPPAPKPSEPTYPKPRPSQTKVGGSQEVVPPVIERGEALPPGLLEGGNIDLEHRPVVHNPDGSISTVRTISVNIDGREVLIPTVSDDGRILTDDEAIEQFRRTGKHLGMFDTPGHATSFAEQLHKDQEALYGSLPPEFEMAPDEGRPQLPDVPLFNAVERANADEAEVQRRSDEYQANPFKFREDMLRANERRSDLETPVVADAARAQAEADNLYKDAIAKATARSAQLDQDAASLANDETWFDRAGTGTKIAGYLAAALAGFLNPTGPNSIVELIKAANEGDVRRRQASLAAGREGVVASIEGAKQMRDASYTALQANYANALQAVDAEMGKYDPLGTKAQNLAATRSALLGEMQAAADAQHKQQVKDALDSAEYDLKTAQARKAQAEAGVAERKAVGGTGTGGGGLAPTGIAGQGSRKDALSAADWQGRGVAGLPDRPAGWTQKEVKDLQLVQKGSQQNNQNTFGRLKQPDGRPFVAQGDTTTIAGAKQKHLAMQTVVRDIDKILEARTGWSSDWAASAENQEIRSALKEATVTLAQNFKLGAISKDDAQHIEGFLTGGLDPTGFRDAKAALLTARNAIIAETNAELQGVGYEGDITKKGDPNYIPPPPTKGRTQSQDEKAVAGVLRVNDPKKIGPLAKRLGAIAVDGVDDPDFDRDAATATLRLIKKKGGKYGTYADNLLKLADIPRYTAQWEAENKSYQKLGYKPEEKPANPDADFFEETPADYEARLRRDIDEFEDQEADAGRLQLDPGDDIVTGGD